MTFAYLAKNKNRALRSFKEHQAKVEDLFSKEIEILTADNGKEFRASSKIKHSFLGTNWASRKYEQDVHTKR